MTQKKDQIENGEEISKKQFRSAIDYIPLTKEEKKAQRKYLDERLTTLHHRQLVIENELKKLESHYYRVCIFGSARIKEDNPIYSDVQKLARLLASIGIDILTGGGPGLMEAANKGAQQGKQEAKNKVRSYGLSIELEFEPIPNSHLDIKRHHHKFSSRLDDFMRLSNAVILTPGGIGSLLELVFTWQLIQVKHLPPRPIVLMDKVFWTGFIEWMRDFPQARKLIGPNDLTMVTLVDTPEEVLEVIKVDHSKFLTDQEQIRKSQKAPSSQATAS